MRTTESASYYNHLEKMSVNELLTNMNKEDQTVPHAVNKAIPQIQKLVEAIVPRMEKGGRLFYIGAGTSGRLGILDASECPPTYGVPHDLVIGIIAGGDTAIRKAVENAEDDPEQAWADIQAFDFNAQDTVIGIAASGTTPYVIGGVKNAMKEGLLTGCITCNEGSPLAKEVAMPIEIVVGPEFVTGSTRMKSGTAQKLALNMISTSVMIKLGKVKGNKMVDMQLSNKKLVQRGALMIMEATGLEEEEALAMLKEHGSVRNAVEAFEKRV
ncbi:N-acetylmuramic acid 6-phosphate etherase [Cyclobacterium marinum]|uniref:N-acetylmuramic acid 6-phosphate etherase n=1 Tax=Cyclobacterium marinum (strain ATCC 25205 / DSM 745 / LMG 13164 / NCIMB 1802) TaxID=880070 RepID=G0J197_CYCMS|nr:N-acetylmuramic acid 6-phosphate etherase [Cyclobacterium marinum]AEL26536.1 N-acetylmuramic acid 6-phosphate etherase [Cyclobacterium marinum DSM 745]MBI0399866.1 N-acetylmuramic acid 6-phosphate etherase [Cyclobacterium marinum]MBR9776047.1 N-acetylmuramic acid 6-phosphate etherase [Cytophagales bacterium]|tara:strand:+ start:18182 stop:18991 length:810 start_codon:yes stop_codon:yes gene_type:complete